MRQPAVFNMQFLREPIDGVARLAADCQLTTHPAGTPGSNLATYTDAGGLTTNTNPIILDAYGRCNLWLDPTEEYLLRLLKPVAEGGALIVEFDNVVAAAAATEVVTSVNGETGAVTLTPELIEYTGPTLDWFAPANVQDALDTIATRLDAPPAESVTITDADTLFTATNVEDALAELAGSSKLPARTDKEGYVLAIKSDGTLEWQRRETSYLLAVNDGSTATRTVRLSAGTWQIVLDSRASQSIEGVTNTITQQATVGAVNVSTSIFLSKAGGFGGEYAHGSDIAVGTLVVATEDDYDMTIDAMVLGGATGQGSILRLEKA